MTPEEKKLLLDTAEKLDKFLDVYYRTNFVDRMVIIKDLELKARLILGAGSSLDLSGTSQLKLGNAATTIGLYGATPVAKAGAIATPNPQTGAYVQADVQSLKTAIDAIRTALTNIGITA